MIKKFLYSNLFCVSNKWTFKEDLLHDMPEMFGQCGDYTELKVNLEDSGVLATTNKFESEEYSCKIIFSSENEARSFVDRLNSYIKRMSELL